MMRREERVVELRRSPSRGPVRSSFRLSRARLAATLGLAVATLLPLPAGAAKLSAQQARLLALERPGFVTNDSLGLVDRIIAVVGDTAILRSELREELLRLQAQGVQMPAPGTPAFEDALRQILASMIDRMILLQRAKRVPDLVVNEDEVEAMVDERVAEVRAQFPSDEALQQEVERSGMNMFQYRQMLRAQARAERLLTRFRSRLADSGELPPVAVTEEEIHDYFERFATGETRPATVSFDRLVVDPEPDSVAADSARALAQKALEEIRAGTEFAVAARRYSNDEGTRAEGGDLGWLRRHQVVPAFADVAWAAPLGRPVGPVRTRFGYHVIKVENTRAGERKLRHILIEPEIDAADIERARERGEALADSLRGGVDPTRLARRHDLREEEVRFDDVPMDELLRRLGAEYARQLAQPSSGQVLGPFEARDERGEPVFAVVQVREFKPQGPYRLEDVRDRVRQQLLQQKQFSRYLENLRDETYVEILL